MKVIIADTGPLIHLMEAQALSLLPTIGEIYVTPQVLREWQEQPVGQRPDVIPEWISVVEPSIHATQQATSWVQSGVLQIGEAESLAVATELRPDWFLTDDAAARELAASLGVESHDSLGVRHDLLWIPSTTAFRSLRRSDLWIASAQRKGGAIMKIKTRHEILLIGLTSLA